jgi:hypothetical protein
MLTALVVFLRTISLICAGHHAVALDELRKLGIEISERTVSRLLRRRPNRPSQTWRTFLANHVAALVSMDFFTVATVTGLVLFVLVLLAHERRRIVRVAIPEHPTASWTAQQIIEAFPDDTVPRWLVRDRDASTVRGSGAA